MYFLRIEKNNSIWQDHSLRPSFLLTLHAHDVQRSVDINIYVNPSTGDGAIHSVVPEQVRSVFFIPKD